MALNFNFSTINTVTIVTSIVIIFVVHESTCMINNFRFKHSNTIRGSTLPFSVKIYGTYYIDIVGTPELEFMFFSKNTSKLNDSVSDLIIKSLIPANFFNAKLTFSGNYPPLVCTGDIASLLVQINGTSHKKVQERIAQIKNVIETENTFNEESFNFVKKWDYFVATSSQTENYKCKRLLSLQSTEDGSGGYEFSIVTTFESFQPIAFIDAFGIGVFNYKRIKDPNHIHYKSGQSLRYCGGVDYVGDMYTVEPRPKCPATTPEDARHHGKASITVYKPNIVSVKRPVTRCITQLTHVHAYENIFGSSRDAWRKTRTLPTSAEYCREWKKTLTACPQFAVDSRFDNDDIPDDHYIKKTWECNFVKQKSQNNAIKEYRTTPGLGYTYSRGSTEAYDKRTAIMSTGLMEISTPSITPVTPWMTIPKERLSFGEYTFNDITLIWDPIDETEVCPYVARYRGIVDYIKYKHGDYNMPIDVDNEDEKYTLFLIDDTHGAVFNVDSDKIIRSTSHIPCVPDLPRGSRTTMYHASDNQIILVTPVDVGGPNARDLHHMPKLMRHTGVDDQLHEAYDKVEVDGETGKVDKVHEESDHPKYKIRKGQRDNVYDLKQIYSTVDNHWGGSLDYVGQHAEQISRRKRSAENMDAYYKWLKESDDDVIVEYEWNDVDVEMYPQEKKISSIYSDLLADKPLTLLEEEEEGGEEEEEVVDDEGEGNTTITRLSRHPRSAGGFFSALKKPTPKVFKKTYPEKIDESKINATNDHDILQTESIAYALYKIRENEKYNMHVRAMEGCARKQIEWDIETQMMDINPTRTLSMKLNIAVEASIGGTGYYNVKKCELVFGNYVVPELNSNSSFEFTVNDNVTTVRDTVIALGALPDPEKCLIMPLVVFKSNLTGAEGVGQLNLNGVVKMERLSYMEPCQRNKMYVYVIEDTGYVFVNYKQNFTIPVDILQNTTARVLMYRSPTQTTDSERLAQEEFEKHVLSKISTLTVVESVNFREKLAQQLPTGLFSNDLYSVSEKQSMAIGIIDIMEQQGFENFAARQYLREVTTGFANKDMGFLFDSEGGPSGLGDFFLKTEQGIGTSIESLGRGLGALSKGSGEGLGAALKGGGEGIGAAGKGVFGGIGDALQGTLFALAIPLVLVIILAVGGVVLYKKLTGNDEPPPPYDYPNQKTSKYNDNENENEDDSDYEMENLPSKPSSESVATAPTIAQQIKSAISPFTTISLNKIQQRSSEPNARGVRQRGGNLREIQPIPMSTGAPVYPQMKNKRVQPQSKIRRM